jgi:ditrans,polycis-polyprenyl diphosphate synthase
VNNITKSQDFDNRLYLWSFFLHVPLTLLILFAYPVYAAHSFCMLHCNFNPTATSKALTYPTRSSGLPQVDEMEIERDVSATKPFHVLGTFIRKFIFRILSVGTIPNHISFIMDGNRRYAKKLNPLAEEADGHKAGFLALISMLNYCYELGVKYVSIYAFSIENFKRRPDEVQNLMDLMLEKIQGLLKEESIVNQYGVRVYFRGNLTLLTEPIRAAAEEVMMATAKNTNLVLLICVAYTSSDDIMHSIQESCKDKWVKIQEANASKACNRAIGSKEYEGEEQATIKLIDIEKHMYMDVAPNPDILIRTSGETRLSNFLLWQTRCCLLYSPTTLWPEIGLRHLVRAVLDFQRHHSCLEKKKKQA